MTFVWLYKIEFDYEMLIKMLHKIGLLLHERPS